VPNVDYVNKMCVCVCVCARARVYVCACVKIIMSENLNYVYCDFMRYYDYMLLIIH